MAESNLYQVLGVDKSASDAEIKKAYRKLARQYHPDVSKDPDAGSKMANINAAYDTLQDPQKRAEYDQLQANPQGFAGRGSTGASGGFGQQDFGAGGFGRQAAGGQGFGTGGFDFSDLFGAGFASAGRQQSSRDPNQAWRGEDQHAQLSVDLSAVYEGAERNISLRVPSQTATGSSSEQIRTLSVKIPKGIKNGQQIRLSGQGLAGGNGGAQGDLYLEIQITPDPRYRIEDADVYMQLPVAPWEAALGGSITVNTPAGMLQLNIPAHSQTGRQLRLKGKGVPAKQAGDLYLELRVVLPPAQTEQAKAAYQRMADELAFNPRAS